MTDPHSGASPVDAPDPSPVDDPTEPDQESAPSTPEITALRREAAKWRRQARDLEARLAEHEAGQLSELEQAHRRAAALEAEKASWEQERRTSRLERLFAGAGAQYAELLAARVDPADVEWTETGTIRNERRLVAEMRERYPSLFKAPVPPPADGGAGTGKAPPTQDMNSWIRQAAGRG